MICSIIISKTRIIFSILKSRNVWEKIKKEWYCTGITCSSDRWITSTVCGYPYTLFSSFFPLKKMLEKYFWGIIPKPLFVKKRTDFLFNKTEKRI